MLAQCQHLIHRKNSVIVVFTEKNLIKEVRLEGDPAEGSLGFREGDGRHQLGEQPADKDMMVPGKGPA